MNGGVPFACITTSSPWHLPPTRDILVLFKKNKNKKQKNKKKKKRKEERKKKRLTKDTLGRGNMLIDARKRISLFLQYLSARDVIV